MRGHCRNSDETLNFPHSVSSVRTVVYLSLRCVAADIWKVNLILDSWDRDIAYIRGQHGGEDTTSSYSSKEQPEDWNSSSSSSGSTCGITDHHSRHQNECSSGSSALPSSGSVCQLCAELQVDQTWSTWSIKVSAPPWNLFGSHQNDGECFFDLFLNNYFSYLYFMAIHWETNICIKKIVMMVV